MEIASITLASLAYLAHKAALNALPVQLSEDSFAWRAIRPINLNSEMTIVSFLVNKEKCLSSKLMDFRHARVAPLHAPNVR